jgi:hypothetical protein
MSKWQLAGCIIDYDVLPDARTSSLLDGMLSLRPTGEQPGVLFMALFLKKLPQDVRDHLCSRNFDSVRTWPFSRTRCGTQGAVRPTLWWRRSDPGHRCAAAAAPSHLAELVKGGRLLMVAEVNCATTMLPMLREHTSEGPRVPGREMPRPPERIKCTQYRRRTLNLLI